MVVVAGIEYQRQCRTLGRPSVARLREHAGQPAGGRVTGISMTTAPERQCRRPRDARLRTADRSQRMPALRSRLWYSLLRGDGGRVSVGDVGTSW